MATAKPRRVAAPAPRAPRLSLPSRLALREILTHKVRSLLVLLLVALPVAAAIAALTVEAGTHPKPAELTRAKLGDTASARVLNNRSACRTPDPLDDNVCLAPVDTSRIDSQPDLATMLPGAKLWTTEARWVEVDIKFQGRTRIGETITLYDAHALQGPAASANRLYKGSLPGRGEVAIDRTAQNMYQLGIGDVLAFGGVDHRITGIVRTSMGGSGAVYLPDGESLPPLEPGTDPRQVPSAVTWVTGVDVDWPTMTKLASEGYGVFSRTVAANPPPVASPFQGNGLAELAMPAFFGALGMFTVVCLSGAAFAISVKQQRRSLGLLLATGAEQAGLTRMIRSQGVWLGGAGVVVGAGLGLAGGAALAAALDATGRITSWGVHVPVLGAIVVMVLGFVSAVLAAVLPARELRRLDALAAVRTSVAPSAPPRFSLRGVVLLVAGVVACLAVAGIAVVTKFNLYRDTTLGQGLLLLLFAGVLLLVAGMLSSLGGLLHLLGKVAPSLSLRLSLRDAVRNRSRTIPSVASVLMMALLSSAVIIAWAGNLSQRESDTRGSNLVRSQVAVWAPNLPNPTNAKPQPGTVDADAVSTIAGRTVPVRAKASYDVLDAFTRTPPANECRQTAGTPEFDADVNCQSQLWTLRVISVEAAHLPVLLGREPRDEERVALAAGKALVMSTRYLSGGTCGVEVNPREGGGDKKLDVPCVLVTGITRARHGMVLMSPELAAKSSLETRERAVVLDFGRELTWEEAQQIKSDVEASGPQGRSERMQVEVPDLISPGERRAGWITTGGAIVVVLLVAAVTTALAIADGRSDEATFAAVGAGPTFRKRMAAGQMFVVAGVSTILGAAAALLALRCFTVGFHEVLPFAVPWGQLALLCVATPVFGALVAWIVTPARMQMVRRLE